MRPTLLTLTALVALCQQAYAQKSAMLTNPVPALPDKKRAEMGKSVSILAKETKLLQLSSKLRIKEARMDNPKVARVEVVKNVPEFVRVVAIDIGQTKVQLVGEDGKIETIVVHIVAVAKKGDGSENPDATRLRAGQSKVVATSTKEFIREATMDNPKVAYVAAVNGDPSVVRITAIAPGRTHLILVPNKGKAEVIEIFVADKKAP